VLALSATVTEKRITAALGASAAVWAIVAEQPGNDVMRRPEDLQEFRRLAACRTRVSRIGSRTVPCSFGGGREFAAPCRRHLGRAAALASRGVWRAGYRARRRANIRFRFHAKVTPLAADGIEPAQQELAEPQH
jgi:hypothetical protein